MTNAATGVKAIVDKLQEEQAEAWREGAAEQLALIPTDRPAQDPQAVKDARKGGRPAGALNKKTQEMLAYLKSRYTHPLEALAQTWSRPVAVLAAELGCDLVKARELQQDAAKASLPYWASKQPIAVSLEKTNVVKLVIVEEPSLEAGDGEDVLIIDGIIVKQKIEEDQ